MAVDAHSTPVQPGAYQDLGARANISEQVVTAIAVGIGVVVVALMAVLMGLA
jgi:hypothetical protein